MEFLSTPDIGAAARWTSTPGNPVPATSPASALRAATPTAQPGANNAAANPPPSSSVTPAVGGPATVTPAPQVGSTPYFPQLDRAGIKNSFQSLFSPNPNVAATPALLSRTSAPGLTPFISGINTPGLVAPNAGMLSGYTPNRPAHEMPTPSPSGDAVLSTPYLQAAAKEAVRREFMNMPSYVTSNGMPATAGERVVPGNEYGSPGRPPLQVMAKTGSTAPSPAHVARSQNDTRGSTDAKVPSSQSPQVASQTDKSGSSAKEKAHTKSDAVAGMRQPQVQQYFVPPAPQPPAPQPPGMVMIGQHGMMMGPPPGAMYAAPPPGVMMFAGGQPMIPQGMVMHAPHPVVRPQGPPVKAESQAERKARVEHEKQELIREFKKKTREAALVRFRQKRRERRFGKLIRYDCRKKLADARPRVKGRFVRIKADEDDLSEGPQVVPNFDR